LVLSKNKLGQSYAKLIQSWGLWSLWIWERNFCLFKHRKKIEEPGHSEPDDIIDAIENISVSVVNED
jgi:hypothetical protein